LKLRSVAFALSLLLLVVSIAMFLVGASSYVLSLVLNEQRDAEASLIFTAASLIWVALFGFLTLRLRGAEPLRIEEGVTVVALVWLAVPAVSAVTYVASMGMNPVDAFFESLSGFTGTGLTVILRPEEAPRVVLMWRAVTQWMGELGVVIVAGVILPVFYRVIRTVYAVERGAYLVAPRFVSTVRRLFTLYVAVTALGAAMLVASGMDLFDALTHSMTGIATGGMSTKSSSVGFWYSAGNYAVLASTAVIMVLGALNFVDLYNLFRGRLRRFIDSPEVRGLLAILVVASIALILTSWGSAAKTLERVYHFISGFTTTGFQLTDLYPESEAIKTVLILGMAVGGATFSTAGGMKIMRFLVALKALESQLVKPMLPEGAVYTPRLGGVELSESDIASALSFIALYAVTNVLLSFGVYLSLKHSGIGSFSLVDAVFETTSALSCVGLSVGITTVAPISTKLLLMVAMYLGKIEFVPAILVAGYIYRKKIVLG